MKTNKLIREACVIAIMACTGGFVVSCSSSSDASPAASVPAVGALAPVSMGGKTLMLDHSLAEGVNLGMTENADAFSAEWQNNSAAWMPAQQLAYGQWKSAISFDLDMTTIDLGGGEKETYSYQKIFDADAIITSSYYPVPDEVYPNGTMRLKFISPTEAEAQYVSGGVDDRYFFRKVRVIIK